MIFPHGNIESVAQDIYMVRGSIQMNAMLRISRNMAIIHDEGQLSLIDPIRLNEEVESELLKLGKIKHIIRLGAFHGLDDCYYVEKFGATMWSQPGGETYTEPTIDVPITKDTKFPFPDAKAVLFKKPKQPECVLHIDREGGTLLTCDAIQHYGDYSFNNRPARLIMPFIGFPKTTIVGPMWLKFMTPEGESLEQEFRNLLDLKFERLLSAHGTLLASDAHEGVANAVNKAFG